MITQFKIFESVNRPYKDGDYLIISARLKGVVEDQIVQIHKTTMDSAIHVKKRK